jgi:curved DNA-binding protein CbpA
MAAINKAYETLSQPQRRLTYDRIGEDRPPDVDRIARDLVSGRIIAWLNSEQNSGDLISDVAQSFLEEQREQTRQIQKGTKLLEQLQRRIKRLKFKGKGIDLVKSAVNLRIKEIKQQTEKMKDHVANLERAKELLKTYEYDPEMEAPPPVGGFFVIAR